MPIRADLRPLYRGAPWRETRRRILERAGGRCEQCHKPDRKPVWVYRLAAGQIWQAVQGPVWYACWWRGGAIRVTPDPWAEAAPRQPRPVRVILTVAHLNHVAGDDRDENLKALCQWCHLHYDQPHHKETRCARKDQARPLLQEAR